MEQERESRNQFRQRDKKRRGAGRWIRLWAALACLSLGAAGAAYGQPRWVWQEDGWQYCDENGQKVTGWVEDKEQSYYLLADGSYLKNAVTPDGYYVDEEGVWYERSMWILQTEFHAPGMVPSPGNEWAGKDALTALAQTVNDAFGQDRRMRVTEGAVEYTAIRLGSGNTTGGTGKTTGTTSTGTSRSTTANWGAASGGSSWGSTSRTGSTTGSSQSGVAANTTAEETILLGIYREQNQGQYRLDIRLKLDSGSTDTRKSATYDFAVYQAMIYQMTSAPELLGEAIISAWQGDNHWEINRQSWVQVGDCQVLYAPDNGYGSFLIRPGNGM